MLRWMILFVSMIICSSKTVNNEEPSRPNNTYSQNRPFRGSIQAEDVLGKIAIQDYEPVVNAALRNAQRRATPNAYSKN